MSRITPARKKAMLKNIQEYTRIHFEHLFLNHHFWLNEEDKVKVLKILSEQVPDIIEHGQKTDKHVSKDMLIHMIFNSFSIAMADNPVYLMNWLAIHVRTDEDTYDSKATHLTFTESSLRYDIEPLIKTINELADYIWKHELHPYQRDYLHDGIEANIKKIKKEHRRARK